MYEIDYLSTFMWFIVASIFVVVGMAVKAILGFIINEDYMHKNTWRVLLCEFIPLFVIGYLACSMIVNK